MVLFQTSNSTKLIKKYVGKRVVSKNCNDFLYKREVGVRVADGRQMHGNSLRTTLSVYV